MHSISKEEQKIVITEILSNFDMFCKMNSLVYCLAYGTALGAARHNGFIPWDDDIDVIMPRNDFDRMIELWDNTGRYKVLSHYKENSYYAPLTKIIDSKTILFQDYGYKNDKGLGLYIDVFCFDGMSSNYFTACIIQKRCQLLTRFWDLSSRKILYCHNIIKVISLAIIGFPFRIIGYKKFISLLDKTSSVYPFDSSKYIGNLMYALKDAVYSKDELFPTKELTFEGRLYPVPNNIDAYLEKRYGNYMKFPPVSKRITNHRFTAFWL